MAINNTTWNRLRYSLYAPFYNIIKPIFQGARKRSIELVSIKRAEKVLLVGCGTGLDLEFLPKDCQITAIDLTPAMVEKSSKVANKLGLEGSFKVMNAEELDFKDASFDVIILHLILAVVPDPIATIKEVSRVLGDQGRVVILDKFLPDGAKASIARKAFNGIANAVFSDVNRKLGPILEAGDLKITLEEKSIFKGAFAISTAQKK